MRPMLSDQSFVYQRLPSAPQAHDVISPGLCGASGNSEVTPVWVTWPIRVPVASGYQAPPSGDPQTARICQGPFGIGYSLTAPAIVIWPTKAARSAYQNPPSA